jgi:predicted DNA-binding transcriptional regulator AlpA
MFLKLVTAYKPVKIGENTTKAMGISRTKMSTKMSTWNFPKPPKASKISSTFWASEMDTVVDVFLAMACHFNFLWLVLSNGQPSWSL